MNISVRNTETDILRLISGGFKRHPLQVNRILEADAEIIRLPGNDEAYLVVKTDGIHEEIREKLYEDAYLIGWMMVTAPVSDIAAVGATPTGILLSLILPRYFDEVWLNKFSNGVRDACNRYKIYVLGGDTNFDTYFSVSATVIANIFNQPPLMRTGIKAGDYLYSTSLLGVGNAYAYSRFFDTSFNVPYQPFAKLDEANMIARYASSCIDTSDGLFPALAVLAEINDIGFSLDTPLKNIVSNETSAVINKTGLPEWIFLAGPHGEYELLFSIPEAVHEVFQKHCKEKGYHPVYLGTAKNDKQLDFITGSATVRCHPAVIPNLFYEAEGNVHQYFELLVQQHKKWNK